MNLKKYSCIVMVLFSIFSVNAHDSHTHEAPWQACEQKQKSQQCSYNNGAGDLFKGTCQLFSKVLKCVRNEPIISANELAKQAKQKIIDKNSHIDSN